MAEKSFDLAVGQKLQLALQWLCHLSHACTLKLSRPSAVLVPPPLYGRFSIIWSKFCFVVTAELSGKVTVAKDWNRMMPILLFDVSVSFVSSVSAKSLVNVLTSWKFGAVMLPDVSNTKTVSVVNVHPVHKMDGQQYMKIIVTKAF